MPTRPSLRPIRNRFSNGLLTAGHSRHLHESFSPDGTRILFQSALLSGGKGLDLFVVGISPSAPRF
jgi:Tol biopolymer transport system component